MRRIHNRPSGAAAIFPLLAAVMAWIAVLVPTSVPARIDFRHIARDQGLSHGTVYSLARDRQGFMWFGTENGLDRYDGYEITSFYHEPSNPNSLSTSNAGNISIDQQGVIWIGTWGGGLNRYDPVRQSFTCFRHDPARPNSLPDDRVQCVRKDSRGYVWVGTLSGGLARLDPKTRHFEVFAPDPADPHSISNDRIWAIAEDGQGDLWIATDSGLNRFDWRRGVFQAWFHDPADAESLSHSRIRTVHIGPTGIIWAGTQMGLNRFDPKTGKSRRYYLDPGDLDPKTGANKINAVFEDETGKVWIGSASNGLYELDPVTRQMQVHAHDPGNADSLSHNDIRCIYGDDTGLMWIATRGGGVNVFDRTPPKFRHFQNDPREPGSLNDNQVRAIVQDSSRNLWIGTNDGGLNRYDPRTGTFAVYMHDPTDPEDIGNNKIRGLFIDHADRLWVAGPNGLRLMDRTTGKFRAFYHDPEDDATLSDDDVLSVVEDQAGVFWVGTYKAGLNRFDPATGTAQRFLADPDDPASLSDNNLVRVFEDSRGRLWVATLDGLNRMNSATGGFVKYFNDPNDPFSLSDNYVQTFHEDRNGNFWIGTFNGLNRLDAETGRFTRYFREQGLPGNLICGILDDEHGRLWISTANGLCRFDPQKGEFRNYYRDDGLGGEEFSVGACFKGAGGEMFFGGLHGFNAFFPDAVREKPFPPPVVLTHFKKFNQPVMLEKALFAMDHLDLSYKDKWVAFEFAALDFTGPDRNRYAYKLEGFDTGWIYTVADNRRAVYTNLDGGDYVFRVKASNSDGVWNPDGTRLKVHITPAPWKRWYAYCLYLAAVIAAVLGFFYRQKRRYRREMQFERLRWEKKSAQAAANAKSEFLANMSHEIRTPMNAIMGLTGLALKTDLTPKQQDYLKKVDASARHLLRIVNDILDYSKIEAGKMELETIDFRLSEVLGTLSDMLAPKAAEKGIELQVAAGQDVPDALQGDPVRLRQVLLNLAGNAIKFTHEGEVLIRVSREAQDNGQDNGAVCLRFDVSDTGVGIAPEKRTRLFNPYAQADGSIARKYGGTGLGLMISKMIVELMQGRIDVESMEGQGTTFTFTAVFACAPPETSETEAVRKQGDITGRRALVVDDSESTRLIAARLLSSMGCQCETAASGDEALVKLQTAAQNGPAFEFVLMDWRMPQMDGFELNRRIKADERLKHLPVILMTAFGEQTEMLQAQSEGVDAFLKKPLERTLLFKAIQRVFNHPDGAGEKKPGELITRDSMIRQTLAGLRVLLVDDNALNRQVASEILRYAGIRAKEAENGRQAVELVASRAFDAVLMDVQMPGMDGYAATREIRKWEEAKREESGIRNQELGEGQGQGQEPGVRRQEEGKGFDSSLIPNSQFPIPIIAMTANAMQGDREKCLEAGMNDYVSKPLEPDELIAVLCRWVAPYARDTGAGDSDEPPDETVTANRQEQSSSIDIAAGIRRVRGNQALYAELLGGFIDSNQHLTRQLTQLVGQGQLSEVSRRIHALKGEAGNIGAVVLHDAALALEDAIKQDEGHLSPVVARLDQALEATCAAAQAYVAQNAATAPPPASSSAAPSLKAEDIDRLADSFRILDHLFKTNDFSAADYLASIRTGLLDRHEIGDALRTLALQVDRFEYDEARKTLRTLCARFEISL